MLEWLKQLDIIVGLIIASGGTILGFAVWYDRRNRQYADSRVEPVMAGQGQTHERLNKLEGKIDDVEDAVILANRRISDVEGYVKSLATRDQVSDVRTHVAKLEGQVEQIDGKVDTIYRAALRSDGGAR